MWNLTCKFTKNIVVKAFDGPCKGLTPLSDKWKAWSLVLLPIHFIHEIVTKTHKNKVYAMNGPQKRGSLVRD